jgi:hypothetical protein
LSSILAVADGDGSAGGFDRLGGERNVGHLLDARLLVRLDVAVLGTVVESPRAYKLKASNAPI